jgi:hypothetical protein
MCGHNLACRNPRCSRIERGVPRASARSLTERMNMIVDDIGLPQKEGSPGFRPSSSQSSADRWSTAVLDAFLGASAGFHATGWESP